MDVSWNSQPMSGIPPNQTQPWGSWEIDILGRNIVVCLSLSVSLILQGWSCIFFWLSNLLRKYI